MLTRQGAAASALSVALVVSGRLFGIFELFLLGAGGATLVIGAALAVGHTRLRLDVSRQLRPTRAHAGTTCTVELQVRNRGSRRTPLLHLRDAIDGMARTASVVLAPLSPGDQIAASYSLSAVRRGILTVGPLEVRISDPFGLAAVSTPGAEPATLTVWPSVEQVLPPPPAGHDADAASDVSRPLWVSGDDFYALRPYTDGDDLRRVHWRASARRDELVVRQDDTRGQGRATIVLDVGASAFGGETFERAVSAAASLVLACARADLLVRLVTTSGHDSGFGSAPAHVEALMEHLAVVELAEVGHLATLLGALTRERGRSAVVAVTGDADRDPAKVAAGDTTGRRSTIVAFTAGSMPTTRAGTASIVVDRSTSFAAVWNRWAAPSNRPARV